MEGEVHAIVLVGIVVVVLVLHPRQVFVLQVLRVETRPCTVILLLVQMKLMVAMHGDQVIQVMWTDMEEEVTVIRVTAVPEMIMK